MSNDPRDKDGEKLRAALHLLGRNAALRAELVTWLKTVEPRIDYGHSVRDDISGPIIDALHQDDDVYEKTLADGTKFEFLYRTKIAREFLLAQAPYPTHVWEPQTTRLLQHLAAAQEGDVLIGGAYFGDHAILLGRQLQAARRKVHCFEPNTIQANMLRRNAQLNALDNVSIRAEGLWDEGSKKLRLDGFDSFANVVLADTEEEGFQTVRIDDYCTQMGCHLGLLMMDIEGAEYRALQGAMLTLQRDKPAIVFEVHRDYVDWSQGLSKAPICQMLLAQGYQLFAVRDFNENREMGSRSIELIGLEHVYLEGPPHGFNMLAVHDVQLVSSTLFHHVKNVSPKLLAHKSPELHHPLDGMPL